MKANIIIVDEKDNVIGVKPRDVVDKEGLRYRVSALWINNSKREVLLARRAYSKSKNPGKWGPAVSGTVEEGESYEGNIIKEAEEELGLKNIKIKECLKTVSNEEYKHFVKWFVCTIDKPAEDFKIQKEEVAEIRWFSKEEFEKQVRNSPGEFLKQMSEYFKLFY